MRTCQDTNSKLTMYFTVNKAFVNYLDKCPNLTESLEFLIIRNKTTFEQTLPISLNISKFDSTLLMASSDLKEFINSCTNHKEIFDLQERHDNMDIKLNIYKNFFLILTSWNILVHYCNNFCLLSKVNLKLAPKRCPQDKKVFKMLDMSRLKHKPTAEVLHSDLNKKLENLTLGEALVEDN